jgi:hypothetical protein
MPTSTANTPSSAPAATQIKGFIDKFDPEIARLTRSCRTALRKRFPTATELVYDNYQALVFGFCTREEGRGKREAVSLFPLPSSLFPIDRPDNSDHSRISPACPSDSPPPA